MSADRQRYDELAALMMRCQPGNDRFMEAWKELESLKNKWGGVPPSQTETHNPPDNPVQPKEQTA